MSESLRSLLEELPATHVLRWLRSRSRAGYSVHRTASITGGHQLERSHPGCAAACPGTGRTRAATIEDALSLSDAVGSTLEHFKSRE